MVNPVKDLSGQRFGRITVLSRADSGSQGHARWNVRCDCGTEWTLFGIVLRRGQTRCRRCGSANYKEVDIALAQRLRSQGQKWSTIEARLGISEPTRLKKGLTDDQRISWIGRHWKAVMARLDAGQDWSTIAREMRYKGLVSGLQSSFSTHVRDQVGLELQRWTLSAHGRVRKLVAEGYNTSRGTQALHMSGRQWVSYRNRPLPKYVDVMLNLDPQLISAWLSKGATWREINEFLNKPTRFGFVLEACYHARLDWDGALEKITKEDTLRVEKRVP